MRAPRTYECRRHPCEGHWHAGHLPRCHVENLPVELSPQPSTLTDRNEMTDRGGPGTQRDPGATRSRSSHRWVILWRLTTAKMVGLIVQVHHEPECCYITSHTVILVPVLMYTVSQYYPWCNSYWSIHLWCSCLVIFLNPHTFPLLICQDHSQPEYLDFISHLKIKHPIIDMGDRIQLYSVYALLEEK